MSYSRKRTFSPTWNEKQQESKQAQKAFLEKAMAGKSMIEQGKDKGEHKEKPENN